MNNNLTKDMLIQSIEHSTLAHTISRIDGDMEMIYVNQAFLDQTLYSKDEVIGRNCRFLQGEGTNPDTVSTIKKALMNSQSLDIEILNYRKDGTPFWNRLLLNPIYDEHQKLIAYVGIQSDATHIKEQDRLTQQRKKLEALGRMSSNISHEIKNALQPVKLMSETLNDWKTLDESKIERCIKILNDSTIIADNITKDVLRFSRPPSEKTEKINIKYLQEDVTRLVKNLLYNSSTYLEKIEEHAFDENVYVNICLNHLHQIVINLVNNAAYAMDKVGTLTLLWHYREIGSAQALELDIKQGAYLCIGIEDTGCGMSKKTINSAFEPFFTTKPPGEGTGLGLSTSYNTIKQWGGTIDIKSKINSGSTFTLYIPVTTTNKAT